MILKNNIYNIEETLSKFPRAKDKLDKWYLDKVFDLQLGVAKEALQEREFRELFEANKEQVKMGAMPYFTYNARDLYEFFDDSELYIALYGSKREGALNEYEYYFDINESGDSQIYSSRWEAEEKAFNKAFEKLESKFN